MQGRVERDISLKEKNLAKINAITDDNKKYYLEYYNYISNTSSPITATNYLSEVIRFCDYLKSIHVEVKNVKPSHYDGYMQSVLYVTVKGEQHKISDSNRIVKYSAIKKFCEYLAINGIIKTNFMEKIKRPKNRDVVQRHALSSEDIAETLREVKSESNDFKRTRNTAILLMFITTGIRESALSFINMEDIDMENNKIIVTDKEDKTYDIFLTPVLKDSISSYLKVRDSCKNVATDALFVSNRGTRCSKGAIKNLTKKYTNYSPHKLRYTFGTMLNDKTHDINLVSKALNHSMIETTRLYIVSDKKEKEKASNIMSELIEDLEGG